MLYIPMDYQKIYLLFGSGISLACWIANFWEGTDVLSTSSLKLAFITITLSIAFVTVEG